MKSNLLTALVLMASLLVGCGDSEPVNINDMAKANKLITQQNGEFNGKNFAKANKKRWGSTTVLAQSDSAVNSRCLFGDGFTSVTFQTKKMGDLKGQCQSDGSDLGVKGCLLQDEFDSKPDYVKMREVTKCDARITSIKRLK